MWIIVKFDILFQKLWNAGIFSQKFRGLSIKIRGLWGFSMDCCEVQGPF
jgi:hypothetical protein